MTNNKNFQLLSGFLLIFLLTIVTISGITAQAAVTGTNAQDGKAGPIAPSGFEGFLKLSGVDGEITDPKYLKQISVVSFEQGVTTTGSANLGGGAGAGKAQFSNIRFRKWVDSASIPLMLDSASGKHLSQAVFSFSRPGSSDFYKVTLSDVTVVSVKQVVATTQQGPLSFDQLDLSTDHSGMLEEVTLSYNKIQWAYVPTTSDGKGAIPTPITGGWNIPANQPN
jgi:type VI secretion system secreted protein Hcp